MARDEHTDLALIAIGAKGMKKFYLCKLCLFVFGALLAVQSVSAIN